MIKKLTLDEINNVYHTRMVQDFPADELRPYKSIETLFATGLYFGLGYYKDDRLMAYALFAKSPESGGALLDYYAVDIAARGTGIGSKFLSGFCTALEPYHVTHVILEVEDPEKTTDEAEINTRNRRISFYKRCLCIMSGVRSQLFGVDYNVMYLSFKGKISDNDIADEILSMYRLILSPVVKTKEDFDKVAKVFL